MSYSLLQFRRMKLLVIVAVVSSVCVAALDCGIGKTNNNEFRTILSMCIRDNETVSKFISMTSDSSSSSSAERVDIHLGKMIKIKRSTYGLYNNDEKYSGYESTTQKNDDYDNEAETESLIPSERCIVNCLFNQLGMLDQNGFPIHEKFVEQLLKGASGREFKDFIEDSVDECFQLNEHLNDSCEYSSKLVNCLADKGKSNCEDWPVGELPFTL